MKLKAKALELYRRNFAVIPVAGKAPTESGWQQLRDQRRMMPNGNFERNNVTGIGVVLGHELETGYYLAVIDVDVTDKEVSRLLCNELSDMLDAPSMSLRVGVKPKFAVTVLVNERITKIRSADYASTTNPHNHIEILCDGQQFVAYGTHPDTQQPYQWFNGDLAEEADNLPKCTYETLTAFLEVADSIMTEHGMTKATPITHQTDDPFAGMEESESSDEEIIALLSYIDPDIDYDNWTKVGMALYRHYRGDSKGLILWTDWSKNGHKFEAHIMNNKWNSFRTERITKLGIPTIAMLARKGGADLSKIAKEFKHSQTDLLEVYTPDTPKSETRFFYADEYTDTLEQPNWIIKHILERDCLAMMYGASGVGKSYVTIDMMCSVAHGHDYHGHPTKPAIVVYMAGEGARGIAARIKAWHQFHDLKPNRNLIITNQIVDMSDANDIKQACDELHSMGITAPAMIILDTLARSSGALDENNTKDMNIFVKNCDAIRIAMNGATVMPIHHSGKVQESGARGSSVLRAAMDVELVVEQDNGIKLASTKMKEGEPFQPLFFNFQRINFEQVDEDGEQLHSAVLIPQDEQTTASHQKPKHISGSEKLLKLLIDLKQQGHATHHTSEHLTEKYGLDAPAEGFDYQDLVKPRYYSSYPNDEEDTVRKRIGRAIERLELREEIAFYDDVIYLL